MFLVLVHNRKKNISYHVHPLNTSIPRLSTYTSSKTCFTVMRGRFDMMHSKIDKKTPKITDLRQNFRSGRRQDIHAQLHPFAS